MAPLVARTDRALTIMSFVSMGHLLLTPLPAMESLRKGFAKVPYSMGDAYRAQAEREGAASNCRQVTRPCTL